MKQTTRHMRRLTCSAVTILALCGGCKENKRSAQDDDNAAQTAVKKYAYEAYGEWSQVHPAKQCPDRLEELNEYMDRKDAVDPWGRPYVMYCGSSLPAGARGGIAVLSMGPDGKEGTDDDIRSW